MRELLLFVSAYFLGNFLTAYVLAKFHYKTEIHSEGSGNVGARNIGRLFGKGAFVITFIGDALKGFLIIMIARLAELPLYGELLLLLFVVIGHVFPVFFRFKGGKGMSTFIGGVLTFNPILFMWFACVFLVSFVFIRSLTLAGMFAVAVLPIIMIPMSYDVAAILVASIVSAIILFAHRQNIKEKIYKERNIS